MSRDQNTGFLEPSLGTLSGFSEANIPSGNPNISQSGWSIEQLRQFVTNQSNINFASNEWVLLVSEIIKNHIDDHDNPHEVTLDQITPDLIGGVMAAIVPGSPPISPPFFSYDALYDLSFGSIFPAAYTNQNMYRMSEGGVFTDPSLDVNNLKTDHIGGYPALPLYSSIANKVPSNWATKSTTSYNTDIDKQDQRIYNYPFDFYTVKEKQTYGEYGINIPATQVGGKTYTASVFVIPSFVGGSLIVSQPGDDENVMIVDLDAASFTCSSPQVMGNLTVFPSGVYRISFTYVTNSQPGDIAVRIVHRNPNEDTTIREGQLERHLFTVAKPLVSTSDRNHPVLIDSSLEAKTSNMVIDPLVISAPNTFSEFMVTLSFIMYPSLPGTIISDNLVFSFGNLSITRDAQYFYLKLAGITIIRSPIQEGLNNLSLSYSPTRLIIKDLINSRYEFKAKYPLLTGSSFVVGPCQGYLRTMSMYAVSDTNRCVEYLNNG